MDVRYVVPRLLEGDLCVHLLLVVDFSPSCSEVSEKSTDGAVGAYDVVLLQFFDVMGINRGDNEFDGNIGDCELCPPFIPEDVLVRFEGQLIESGCVHFDCNVEFSGLREVAVCEGAAGCAGDVSFGERKC